MAYMRPKEVADKYRLSLHSLREYERRGYLRAWRTPGGHRRYLSEEVESLCPTPHDDQDDHIDTYTVGAAVLRSTITSDAMVEILSVFVPEMLGKVPPEAKREAREINLSFKISEDYELPKT